MVENQLKVKSNGTYKNVDLKEMNNGDVIVVKKKFGEVRRTEKVGNKWNPDKKWTMCQTVVEYNGQDVGIFFPNLLSSTGYVDNTKLADKFDEVGGIEDSIKITMTKGLGKDSKGNDAPVYDLTFEKI